MRLKITSDGTVNGTYIQDINTGNLLGKVKSFSWSANAESNLTEAVIHLYDVPCDLISEVNLLIKDDGK